MQGEERLIIKNFACIKNIDIELKRFTVFIGEQASGKSITCKAYFFLKHVFFGHVLETICYNSDVDISQVLNSTREEFEKFFPAYMWRNDTFTLEWRKQDIWLKIEHRKNASTIRISCSPLLTELYGKIHKRVNIESAKQRKEGIPIRVQRLELLLSTLVDYTKQLGFETVAYIPAGRSFFSTIQRTVFTLLAENKGIDPFLREFGKFYEQICDMVRFDEIDYAQARGRKIESVLKGKYKFEGKEHWLVCGNKTIRVADTSSGQQEALPLLLGLHSLASHRKQSSVVIEEPEAHLYPLAQQTIISLVYDLLGHEEKANRKCLLTTHSPYILACINNEIMKDDYKRRNDVAAYHLHDGVATDIFNKDTGLIYAKEFDEISFTIANDSSQEE